MFVSVKEQRLMDLPEIGDWRLEISYTRTNLCPEKELVYTDLKEHRFEEKKSVFLSIRVYNFSFTVAQQVA
jgi:hypothetical protein